MDPIIWTIQHQVQPESEPPNKKYHLKISRKMKGFEVATP